MRVRRHLGFDKSRRALSVVSLLIFKGRSGLQGGVMVARSRHMVGNRVRPDSPFK
jgi:hypothetical protein